MTHNETSWVINHGTHTVEPGATNNEAWGPSSFKNHLAAQLLLVEWLERQVDEQRDLVARRHEALVASEAELVNLVDALKSARATSRELIAAQANDDATNPV